MPNMFRNPKAIQHLGYDQMRTVWFRSARKSLGYFCILPLFVCFIVAKFVLLIVLPVDAWGWRIVLICSSFPAILALIYYQSYFIHKHLAQTLFEMGIRPRFCGRCEYDLRASADAEACPECGAPLAPMPTQSDAGVS